MSQSALTVITSLLSHAAWANAEVLRSLRTSPGTDPHALEQFAHVLAAENVWLTRIRGEPQGVAVWPALSVDECERLAATNHTGFETIVSQADTHPLEREVAYTNSAGRAFSSRVIDILLHVAMHGMYHRGMTSVLTRRSGGTPAPTDFIAYVRGVPTATRADTKD